MNLQNLFKKIVLVFCLLFLSHIKLRAQYFQSVENSFIGCWKMKKLKVSEITQCYCFSEDKAITMGKYSIEETGWKIGRDSIVTEQHTYKSIGGHVLNIGNYYFAVLVVTEKRLF